MASAGTVTLDFAAETAKFTAELKKVRADLRGLKGDVEVLSKFTQGVGNFLKGFLTIGSVLVGIRAVIHATQESEAAIAQLNAALKTAGPIVNKTSKEFQDFASQLQRTTTFTDEAIIGVESILLSFKGLSGDTVLRATSAITDISTRLKIDLTSAAKIVGRALADPVKGLQALGRARIFFSSTQKELVKDLVEHGKLVEAQTLILGELEGRYRGAAAAARDTFGGALIGIKNAFGDLLEAKAGMPAITKELNRISDVLSDPKTKEGFDSFLGFLAKGATFAIRWAAALGAVIDKVNELDKRKPVSDEFNIFGQTDPASALSAGRASLPFARGERSAGDAAAAAAQAAAAKEAAAGASAKEAAELTKLAQTRANTLVEFESKAQAEITKTIKEHIKDRHDFELESQTKFQEARNEIDTRAAEERLRLAKEETNVIEQEAERQFALQQAKLALFQDVSSTAIGFLQALSAASDTESKRGQRIQKAAAILSIIVDTSTAVMRTLAAYGGTPVGWAMSAAVIATGALRLAAVKSSTAAGGGQSAFSGTGPGSAPVNPIFTQPSGGAGSGQFTVYINGVVTNEIVDQLLDGLEDRFDRDVVIIPMGTDQANRLGRLGT